MRKGLTDASGDASTPPVDASTGVARSMGGPSIWGGYDENGYVLVPRVVGPDVIVTALDDLRLLRAEYRFDDSVPVVAAPSGWPLADVLSSHPGIRAMAMGVLGRDISCFGFTYLIKPALGGPAARWHQDAGPWEQRLGGAAATTVWLALTGAGQEAGCLILLPGSHRGPLYDLVPDDGDTSMFGVGVAPGTVDISRTVRLPVRPGDAVIHHPRLLHGSGPNVSARPRIAVAIRFRTASPPREREPEPSRRHQA